jgi:homospermidine synthase
VAASVLGALFWMIRNPNEGVMLPDYLPTDEIMAVALPYLGPVISQPVDWMPPRSAGKYDPSDPQAWEFMQFYVTSYTDRLE